MAEYESSIADKDAIIILSADPLEDIVAAGNTAAWRVRADRARGAKYLILCRKAVGQPSHRAAFLIAKVDGVEPRERADGVDDGRIAILFSEYALIDVPDVWNPTHQNPVRFGNAHQELSCEPSEITFSPVPPQTLKWSYSRRVGDDSSFSKPVSERSRLSANGLSIAEAKEGLARRFGCHPGDVEIHIRA